MMFENLEGNRYGRLKVLYRAPNKNKQTVWHCICDCGKEKDIRAPDLKLSKSLSCGCIRNFTARNITHKNIAMQKFGRLLALREIVNTSGRSRWLCLCDCGKETIVNGKDLRSKNTKSCGCLKVENSGYKAGNLHPNYNSTLTTEERVLRRKSPEYINWRKCVFERDKYTCVCCNKKGGLLHAHHIASYHCNEDKRLLVDNGSTLCKRCHKNFHKVHKLRNNTIEQYYQFLTNTQDEGIEFMYKPTVIIDFDGVIHLFSTKWEEAHIIPDLPVPGMKEAIDEMRDSYKVVVVSTRCYYPGGIDAIKKWLAQHDIEVDDVTGEKPPAIVTIDDRAICFDGNPVSLLWKIKNFKPWNKK